MPAEPTRGFSADKQHILQWYKPRDSTRHKDDHIHLTERVFVVTVGHTAEMVQIKTKYNPEDINVVQCDVVNTM